jgi:hypothetical protein
LESSSISYPKMGRHASFAQLEAKHLRWGEAPTARMSSKHALADSQSQMVGLTHGAEAPFLCGKGRRFEIGETTRFTGAKGEIRILEQQWRCQVGAMVPASCKVAGGTGDDTDLTCIITPPSFPSIDPRRQITVWFADAGCLVLDPTRS